MCIETSKSRRHYIRLLVAVTIALVSYGSIHAQDFNLRVNGVEPVFTIPADTLPRDIILNSRISDELINLHMIDTLTFTFSSENDDTTEYLFGPFMYSDGSSIQPNVSFLIEGTVLSSLDSMMLGAVMIDSQWVEGIRYLDLPGDSVSGFQVVLSGEDPNGPMWYIQIQYTTEACADWRNFQPLEVGNIWHYNFGSGNTSEARLEILDLVEIVGSQTYIVARERISGWPHYLMPPDTFTVITHDTDPYRIYWDGGDYNFLICDFRPLTGEMANWAINGIVPTHDGSLDYLVSSTGGSDSWRLGIGRYSGGWDGGGSLDLIGYRVGDIEWGNLGHLVNIQEEPPLPDNFTISIYPNPFNSSFNLEFQTLVSGETTLEIYNLKGVQLWSESFQVEANIRVTKRVNVTELAGKAMASGVYFVRINSGPIVEARKILLAK